MFFRRVHPFLFSLGALLLLLGCAPAYLSPKPKATEPSVRVAVAHRLPLLTIEADDTVWASDGRYTSPIAPGNSWTVTARQGRLEASTSAGSVISDIEPKLSFRSQKAFSWNGQPLAWPLAIFPENDSALLAVIELPLEEYLIGVLAKEMGNAGEAELEALKAQAVAARGYAYVKIGTKPGAAYDLESDVSHQAFDLIASGDPIFRKAVDKTRGQVMACRGRVFAPNYHSTCGGRTALPSEVWGMPDSLFPWAKSVKCVDCSASPRYRWNMSVSSGELVRHAAGLSDATVPVTDVRVMERGPSGRVLRLKVSSQAGDTVLSLDRIRFQLAEKDLPSTWFDARCERGRQGNVASVELNGRGYGHGVGMCQWGAMGMAREGKGYKKILCKYFNSIRIEKKY